VRRLAVPAVAVALLAAAIAFEVASSGSGDAARPAPALPTTVLRAPRTTLATLRGKPALVNFWASWCAPCRQEAPGLERLWRSLRGSATVVGVDFDDERGAAREFIRAHGLTYPMLSDPDGASGPRFGFSGLPTTVVLDPRGRIVETLRGPQSEADMRRALRLAAGEGG
jgi:cytochrome c biogenesis protein CcmG/thiol:disulfide interchange protein DsbE